jgi:hypothetical protein
VSDEIEMFSNEWWTLPAEEKRERMRAWEAQRGVKPSWRRCTDPSGTTSSV